MARYLIEPRDRISVKGYGLMSFAKNMSENICENISKNLKPQRQKFEKLSINNF